MRITPTQRLAGATASVAALALVLTACSGSDAEDGHDGAPEVASTGLMEDYGVGTTFVASEPLQFGLLYRDHPGYPFDPEWSFLQQLEENQNVTFDFVNVPLSDWEDRRSLLLAAGDAPDIIPVSYAGDEDQFVAGGALLPISDYLDYLPNFVDKIDRWDLGTDLDGLRQEDGKFYLLPGLHEQQKPQYSVAIRADLWEAAGLSLQPATWDEFADQLAVVAEENPDLDHAYTDRWELNATLNAASPNFGTAAGWGFGDGLVYNGSEYEYAGVQEGYRDLVAYFAGLVEDGLLDPESLTQDDDTAIAKFTSGSAAAIGTNDQTVLEYRDTLEETGVEGAEVHQIVVPAGPAGDLLPAGGRFESGLMISSSAADEEYFGAMLQFIDWLYYSDEGLEFAKWGVEGETFTREADGTRVLADDIDIQGLNPGAPESLNADYGYHNGVWMPAHGSTFDLDTSMLRDEVQEFIDGMIAKDEMPQGPPVAMNELEREQASLWRTSLEDTTMQNTAAFILGNRSLDEWDQHVAELESAGLSSYLESANTAAERGFATAD